MNFTFETNFTGLNNTNTTSSPDSDVKRNAGIGLGVLLLVCIIFYVCTYGRCKKSPQSSRGDDISDDA